MSNESLAACPVGTQLTIDAIDDDDVILVDTAGVKHMVSRLSPEYDQEMIASFIDLLYTTDSIHVRRGYRIREATDAVLGVHFVEEAVELQEAVLLANDGDQITEEAGDVLAILMHILKRKGISSQEVIRQCLQKLARYWTTDPDKVNTAEASFGRKKRGEPPA